VARWGERWVVVVGEALVQRSHVEVQALIDHGALLGALRVQGVGLAVLLHQIHLDGAGLPQRESVVHQRGNGVLGIDLQELRLQVLTGLQVEQLLVQLDAHGLGGHDHGAAGGGAGQVVEVNHFTVEVRRTII